jgi:hypothetical protein
MASEFNGPEFVLKCSVSSWPSAVISDLLSADDVALAVAILVSCQYFGRALLSLGQTVFLARLGLALQHFTHNVRAEDLVNTGATNIRTAVPAAELKGVILTYNRALTQVFVSLRFHFGLAKPTTNINLVSDDSCILHRIPDELLTGVEKNRERRQRRER